MNKLFTHSLLAMAIATSVPMTLCTAVEGTPKKTYATGAYYGVHLIAGILSMLSLPVCVAVGAWVADERLVLPPLLGAVAGLGIIYKTPQWIDRIFFYKKPTTKQNVINFITRLLLLPTFPFFGLNILAGTYLSSNIDVDVQEEEPTYDEETTAYVPVGVE